MVQDVTWDRNGSAQGWGRGGKIEFQHGEGGGQGFREGEVTVRRTCLPCFFFFFPSHERTSMPANSEASASELLL